MGAFSYHRFIFLLAFIDCWKAYNRLVSACTVKTAIEVQRLCVSTSKKRHFCLTSSFLTVFFVLVRLNKPGNLVFRTTIIEGTRLTLAAIPFKVEANSSSIFCRYKNTTKNLPSFRSFTVYNALDIRPGKMNSQ